MDARIDLDAASRDELIALIVQQQAVIGRLERRIAQLEDKAKPGGPSGMPGLKPRSSPKSPAPQQSRKPRPHGFSRRRMAPTHRVEHGVESCPDCGTPLSGGWTHRTREVIDLPRVPAQVTEHVFIARVCPRCRRNCLPQAELDGAALGKQRLGVNLVSLSHPAGGGEAAHPQHPMVSAHRPPVAPQRGRHRRLQESQIPRSCQELDGVVRLLPRPSLDVALVPATPSSPPNALSRPGRFVHWGWLGTPQPR